MLTHQVDDERQVVGEEEDRQEDDPPGSWEVFGDEIFDKVQVDSDDQDSDHTDGDDSVDPISELSHDLVGRGEDHEWEKSEREHETHQSVEHIIHPCQLRDFIIVKSNGQSWSNRYDPSQ